jgi:hypothetical protein
VVEKAVTARTARRKTSNHAFKTQSASTVPFGTKINANASLHLAFNLLCVQQGVTGIKQLALVYR